MNAASLPHPHVVIADDHPLFRAALRLAVERVLPGVSVTEADSFEAMKAAVVAAPDADLVLLDLHMPGVRGYSSLVWLRAEHPSVPVVMVSAEEDGATVHRALDFGAAGFIPKSAGLEVLTTALTAVLDGQLWTPPAAPPPPDNGDAQLARRVASLSPQQLKVLMHLADGRLNKQIAYDLEVTEATIKAHVTAILRKLGLYRRTQAAVLAQRLLLSEAVPLDVSAVAGEDDES
ncbi:MAG: response regulator transcription factor [Stagnimonas sp.]|nr:response regulator transcription factor [Stagnimonas sp.]